jgi:hypothetical protein
VPDSNTGNYSDGQRQCTHLAVSTASLSHHKTVNNGQPTNGTQTVLLNHSDYPEDWKKFSVLFPAIDIGNHNPNARVNWTYDPDRFSLSVSEKIEVCSQVYNNYGPKSSEELLMGYGFCAPNNPYDGLLLAMRPPPPPLQQMLSITHPEYFKETDEWNSEAATFRLLHAKLRETSNASPFDQAWGCVPAPLAELFCYVVQLERGVDVTPIDDAEEYLYHGEGRRYLPRIALYIMMSLIPKIGKLEEANEKLPPTPTNHRQASVKIYRDMQYEVISRCMLCNLDLRGRGRPSRNGAACCTQIIHVWRQICHWYNQAPQTAWF